ncbi:MAG: 30S ribosomal protein S12 methylthiotransferase RimO [Nitrospirae bacterium]|nr:30S ribosomal protein S12 methylthiotransferase RimO [Nitrospirota bacterium]
MSKIIPAPAKIHITTLGCPKNTVDSGHLAGAFTAEGFVAVENADDADIMLVNTCGFIKDAKEESIEEVLRLAQMKESGRKLVVFGCLAARYRDELLKEIPEIDGIWGVGEEARIIEYCKKQMPEFRSQSSEGKSGPTKSCSTSPVASLSHAYLKIAEGCDKKCTFCVIPSIRGAFRSIRPELIIAEAREYINAGVRELILVAQDITNYGKEFDGYGLVSLLRDLAALPGDFYIRLLYLYPTAISKDLIECIAAEDKIQKYLDIPLQHSEDKILRLMGRRGTRNEYRKLIRTLRRHIPGVALRTTFITGFPGETEEDFKGLIDFIEEMRFDRLGAFIFSKEEGTPSAGLKGQVPENVKRRRFEEIMKHQSLISLELNRELVGRRFRAIIDEGAEDVTLARLYSHTPEIDGVVIIEKAKVSAGQKDKGRRPAVKVGDVVTVEITDAYDYDLKAEIV